MPRSKPLDLYEHSALKEIKSYDRFTLALSAPFLVLITMKRSDQVLTEFSMFSNLNLRSCNNLGNLWSRTIMFE